MRAMRERKKGRESSVPIDYDPSARVRDKFSLLRAHSLKDKTKIVLVAGLDIPVTRG